MIDCNPMNLPVSAPIEELKAPPEAKGRDHREPQPVEFVFVRLRIPDLRGSNYTGKLTFKRDNRTWPVLLLR